MRTADVEPVVRLIPAVQLRWRGCSAASLSGKLLREETAEA
jgi:hypothetical protein